MKTDDLIRALAADARPVRSFRSTLALALVVGVVAAACVFALRLSPRPHLLALLVEWRLAFKFAVTLSLAAVALVLALRLSQPGARVGRAARALLVPAMLLAAGVAAELVTTPASQWRHELVGRYAIYCTTLIPMIAAPALGALLLALRRGAPTHPTLAGAAAGLAAGGIAAALYALHCVDDSPLFFLTWYSIAVAAVTAVGALVGSRLLRW
ncbi:NrsF family protein [Xanthobacter sp. YC-JY1]|uniref:NrsF family protein n=1 Tax=Xanthobacter sp. YC-JY1 TaxID=2419844 RepID=UPI001F47842F|nr:NrsF family protein [Xanthobacter sp. YC-JY1]UJX46104.1 DUF1109 family protein [Xanthobacter sp. YC-JY1]